MAYKQKRCPFCNNSLSATNIGEFRKRVNRHIRKAHPEEFDEQIRPKINEIKQVNNKLLKLRHELQDNFGYYVNT